MSNFVRIPVESATIASIAHDSFSEVLEVIFRHGGIYEYANISDEKFKKMLKSKSTGRFFNQKIRAKHRYRKVRF